MLTSHEAEGYNAVVKDKSVYYTRDRLALLLSWCENMRKHFTTHNLQCKFRMLNQWSSKQKACSCFTLSYSFHPHREQLLRVKQPCIF